MKTLLLNVLTAILLLIIPKVNFGQSPNLGTTSSFALFSAVGAFNNDGASVVTGDVGTNVGAFNAFPPGTLIGTKHVADPASAQAAIDVANAYSDLFGMTPTDVIGVLLGNDQVIGPGVHKIGAAATLNGNLILDGQGNPNSMFIFQIDGALSTGTFSTVTLINSASLCNVYWQINGAFDLGDNSVFRGTIIANGAITLLEGSSLLGRGLTKAGAISLHNNIVTNPLTVAPTVILTQPTCILATATITIISPIGPGMTYSIDGSTYTNTTGLFTQVTPGTYNITAKSAGGCVSSGTNETINAAQGAPAAPTATLIQPTCILNTGTITVTAPLGTGMTYSIDGSTYTNTNGLFTQVTPGTYNVTAKSADGCVSSGTDETINAAQGAPEAPTATLIQPTCILTTGTITVTAPSGTGITYSIDGSTYTNTNGLFTQVTPGTYNVTAKSADGCVSSGTNVLINSQPLPPEVTTSNKASICGSTSTNISLTASLASSFTWTVGDITGEITGASAGSGSTITQILVNPNNTSNGTVEYIVIPTSTTGLCVGSAYTITVTVGPPATSSIITASGPTIICESESVTLSGNNGGIWSNGETTPLITVDKSGDYFVTNTNDCGDVTSNHIIVTVSPLPICTITYSVLKCSICVGQAMHLCAPAGYAAYLWSTGATTNCIDVTSEGTYNVTVTNSSGCISTCSLYVTVYPAPSAITGNDTTICKGNSITLGTSPVSGNTYSWAPETGLSSAIIANPVASPSVTTTYTLTETNSITGCQKNNSVTVTVNNIIGITTQPGNQIACIGGSVSFSVDATGTGLTYQWRRGTVNLTNGGNISGATSATLIINPVDISNTASDYNVVITGACSSTVTSTNASLEVNAAPSISTSACVGSSVSFSVAATGTDLTYQWRKGDLILVNGGNISGATSATLTINPVSITDASSDYNVVITGSCSPNSTTPSISLVVNSASNIVTDPTDQTSCAGSSASFSVASTGTGLTYQWRRGTINLINGGNISGATSATLTINPVNISDTASNYNVVVNGTCSSTTTSKAASLILCTQTGTTSIEGGNEAVSVYPNPFRTTLNVIINDSMQFKKVELRLYDALGTIAYKTILSQKLTTLETKSFPPGMYFYNISDNNKIIQSGKLISLQ